MDLRILFSHLIIPPPKFWQKKMLFGGGHYGVVYGISKNEAYNIIEDCQAEIDDVLSYGGSYDTVMDIIQDYLGLEPDYLDLFI